jgi:hypothetical protein
VTLYFLWKGGCKSAGLCRFFYKEKIIYLKIYSRMDKNYRDFENLVTGKNPSIEMRSWSTNFDWIARFIKRRKWRKKEDYFT